MRRVQNIVNASSWPETNPEKLLQEALKSGCTLQVYTLIGGKVVALTGPHAGGVEEKIGTFIGTPLKGCYWETQKTQMRSALERSHKKILSKLSEPQV